MRIVFWLPTCPDTQQRMLYAYRGSFEVNGRTYECVDVEDDRDRHARYTRITLRLKQVEWSNCPLRNLDRILNGAFSPWPRSRVR